MELREQITGKSQRKRAKYILEEMTESVNKKWYRASDYVKLSPAFDFYFEYKDNATREELVERVNMKLDGIKL